MIGAARPCPCRSLLGALLLLVGIVLSPLRAAAATMPMLAAFEAAGARATATQVETRLSRRFEGGCAPAYVYDDGPNGYDCRTKLHAGGGARRTHAYDDALSCAERREGREGVIYAARTTRTAAEAVPTLAQAGGREMFRDAMGLLKTANPASRLGMFRNFAGQITAATRGAWSAKEIVAANGTVFAGEGGEALFFNSAGQIFRGLLSPETLTYGGGATRIAYDLLKEVK